MIAICMMLRSISKNVFWGSSALGCASLSLKIHVLYNPRWRPSGDVLVLSGHILKPFTSCSRVRVADSSLGGSLGLGANSWRNIFTSTSTSSLSISAVPLRNLLQKSDSAV
eukprot:scaffold230116_cov55-Attheya_sp.AAC.1